jgi:predicted N-formylglutamate amidohydrolase
MSLDRAAAAVPPQILAPDEAPPFEVLKGDAGGGLLLICDHASNAVPRARAELGLTHAELRRHIGWDIGAAAVTRHLVDIMDAPAVLTRYSRLVIDCNRSPGHPGLIPPVSDRTEVPGNRDLPPAERDARLTELFAPYHAEIDRRIDRLAARAGAAPVVVSIHSFTPVMDGIERPWQIGVLWNRDARLPLPLIARLREEAGLTVGDNEPYSAREGFGHTLDTHGDGRGLANALIEIRQDLIDTDQGARAWAARVGAALGDVLGDVALYRAVSPGGAR